ncbi:uncharacterized protein LOC112555548 [Pomacea canaliculata]|uniref:uncharacterized protein LOC112555548 n=1 Tax=Pomacea canaliculata TaxID=400727 RepID=UPI000D72E408|nr:uncharacterized protein LOC112555548 [Pomacea canaliculata]
MRRNIISLLALLRLSVAIDGATDSVDDTGRQLFGTEDKTKTSSLLQDYTEHVVYTDTSDSSRVWSRDSHHYRDSVVKTSSSTEIPTVVYGQNETFGRLEPVDVDLLTCVIRSQTHQVKGSEGSISMSLRPTSDTGQDQTFVHFCNVELTVPPSMVAYVNVSHTREECIECIRLILRDDEGSLLFYASPNYLPEIFYTYSRSLTILVKIISLSSTFHLLLNFSAVPETSRPQLLVNFTSPNTGYVETPNVDFTPYTNFWVHLVAPLNHIVVISFDDIDSAYTCLSRFPDHLTFRTKSSYREYSICSLEMNGDLDFYPGEMLMEYKVYSMTYGGHFKMMFSFHHVSALPVKLSDGRWNCSAVRWEDMQHHFPCNFVSNCVGGEDEAGCWSGDGTCGAGQVEVDGRCFTFTHVVEEDLSWNDANRWCQERKQQLASFSARTVWDFFMEFFNHLTDSSRIFVGVRFAPSSLPPIYRKSWMWCDETIAHVLELKNLGLRMPNDNCVVTTSYSMRSVLLRGHLTVTSCEQTLPVSYHLCEIQGTPSMYPALQAPDVHVTQPTSRLSKPGYILCPANHFTHVFLACDVTSNCWSKTDGATYYCSPPLTSLPPLFECADIQQSVPYTLVCDHRADCLDGSDENICVFPRCDLDSPFRCSDRRCVQAIERCNGQVDCDDQADEANCLDMFNGIDRSRKLQNSFRIDSNSNGQIVYTELSPFSCPDSHFVCPSLHEVCLPVYFRCNGVNDCPGLEDEGACDRYTCPGFYRCRKTQSVRANSISSSCSSKTIKDFNVALRLMTVVMSDFLCWFPVGLIGILAANEFAISGEVNVGLAIFVLPFNAALNPFLYTINIYLERRRCRREEERQKRIIAQLKLINSYTEARNSKLKLTNNEALDLIKTMLSAKVFSPDELRNVIEVNRNTESV